MVYLNLVKHLHHGFNRVRKKKIKSCEWTVFSYDVYQDETLWNVSCRTSFVTKIEPHDIIYCPFCSKKVKEKKNADT